MAAEKQQRESEEAVGELDANRGTKRGHITISTNAWTLEGIKSAIANCLSDGEAQYDCSVAGRIPFQVQFGKSMLDWLLEPSTLRWFKYEHSEEQQRECVL